MLQFANYLSFSEVMLYPRIWLVGIVFFIVIMMISILKIRFLDLYCLQENIKTRLSRLFFNREVLKKIICNLIFFFMAILWRRRQNNKIFSGLLSSDSFSISFRRKHPSRISATKIEGFQFKSKGTILLSFGIEVRSPII